MSEVKAISEEELKRWEERLWSAAGICNHVQKLTSSYREAIELVKDLAVDLECSDYSDSSALKVAKEFLGK